MLGDHSVHMRACGCIVGSKIFKDACLKCVPPTKTLPLLLDLVNNIDMGCTIANISAT